MSTQDLLQLLSEQTTKADYLRVAEEQLQDNFKKLSDKKYKIDFKVGFTETQRLTPGDLYFYQNFRDSHFIYWGLKGDWTTHDPFEESYFFSIKQEVLNHYDSL